LKVAKIQIALQGKGSLQVEFPVKSGANNIEMAIAISELAFAGNKMQKGFNILENKYLELCERRVYPLALKDWILQKSIDLRNEKAEARFLKESFVNEPMISPAKLRRFLKICGENSASEIRLLIKKIKGRKEYYSFEKVALLLAFDNRIDDLATEFRKEDQKFFLIHEIAMLMLPVQHQAFLAEYMRHFFLAISATRNFIHQQKIADQASAFINKLPVAAYSKVMAELAERLGNGRIAGYMSALAEK
jgi:hypothetical protein